MLVVALALGIPQIIEQIIEQTTHIPPIADAVGTFESPISLPAWANISLVVNALVASTERALRLRYDWLLDDGFFDGEERERRRSSPERPFDIRGRGESSGCRSNLKGPRESRLRPPASSMSAPRARGRRPHAKYRRAHDRLRRSSRSVGAMHSNRELGIPEAQQIPVQRALSRYTAVPDLGPRFCVSSQR